MRQAEAHEPQLFRHFASALRGLGREGLEMSENRDMDMQALSELQQLNDTLEQLDWNPSAELKCLVQIAQSPANDGASRAAIQMIRDLVQQAEARARLAEREAAQAAGGRRYANDTQQLALQVARLCWGALPGGHGCQNLTSDC
jgi:hypothetical protein